MNGFQVEPFNPTRGASSHLPRSLQELQEGFQTLWGNLQAFYCERARVIPCTANTAARNILRGFEPLEEASRS